VIDKTTTGCHAWVGGVWRDSGTLSDGRATRSFSVGRGPAMYGAAACALSASSLAKVSTNVKSVGSSAFCNSSYFRHPAFGARDSISSSMDASNFVDGFGTCPVAGNDVMGMGHRHKLPFRRAAF
jgi:hypothetical protein